jgi:hypothetical protein
MKAAPEVDESVLQKFFRALNACEVECAVFGAVALGLHGLARATGNVDLFLRPDRVNVERLKTALRSVFEDSSIDEISADDLCGDYPAVRYLLPDGFGFDIVTRLGTAFRYEDLECEDKTYQDVRVRVVTARMLWRLKRDTVRPLDRIDAEVLAQRFGFKEE